MATNPKFSAAARNAMADALTAAIGNGGLVKIYTGSQPATPDTAISTQTLLGTLTCGSPFAPAASSGVITANSITQDSSADATGTAAWYRLCNSDGTAVHDGTIGTSAADLILNTTSIVSGGPISVSSFAITVG